MQNYILVAFSLCADCFAVALCSGTALQRRSAKFTAYASLIFAIIHTAFLFAGWAFGSLIYRYVYSIARILAFVLLLYVGGEMLLAGMRNTDGARNLARPLNIILAGIATSIDALAVGAAASLEGTSIGGMAAPLASLFIITVLTVAAGLSGGRIIGRRWGRWARIAGGLVLIGIGVTVIL